MDNVDSWTIKSIKKLFKIWRPVGEFNPTVDA